MNLGPKAGASSPHSKRWRAKPARRKIAKRLEGVRLALLLIRNFNPKGIASVSPGLRGTSYPGSVPSDQSTLKGLKHRHRWEQILAATPVGLVRAGTFSQGSSCLATLGFGPESLWDSRSFGRSSQMRIRSSGLPALSLVHGLQCATKKSLPLSMNRRAGIPPAARRSRADLANSNALSAGLPLRPRRSRAGSWFPCADTRPWRLPMNRPKRSCNLLSHMQQKVARIG